MLAYTSQLYKNAYSGLSRRMWLLALVMLINRCGTMVLPFMTLYCNHKGYTASQGGIAVAFYGLGSIVGAYLGGRLSDHYGFSAVQFFALFGGGCMFILLGWMPDFVSICTCIFFASMINESFRPANASAIAYYSTPQNRTQSFSLVRLSINLGWGIGSALAGFLASINYHLLFWVDGLTNILAAFALIAFLPKVTQEHLKKSISATIEKAKGPYKDTTFLFFLFFMLLFAICFFQLFTTIPLFFKEDLHLDEWHIGLVMALNGILIGLFEMVIVFKLEGRSRYTSLMTMGTLILAASYFLLNLHLSNGFIIALISTVMVTLGEIIGMPFMNSYYISRTTVSNRGQYAALFTMAWSSAQVIGSLLGTRIAHQMGFHVLWWVIGAGCILTAAGFNYLGRRK